jgi:small-conductance mechanosensitive channel
MDIKGTITALLDSLHDPAAASRLLKFALTIAAALVLLLLFNVVKRIAVRGLKKTLKPQQTFMLEKTIQYTGLVVVVLFAMKNLGIDTQAILGAAGILGIVVGFAAQTAVSSFLSGLFILSEKPFSVGDTIQVDDLTGIVLSVDLLSVKLRTFDNIYVRMPNENILKANVLTLTRFPTRRIELVFSVSYDAPLEKVRTLVLQICAQSKYGLADPQPSFRVTSLAASGVEITLLVWAESNFLVDAKTEMLTAIKETFEKEKIEIPYQKIDVNIKPQDIKTVAMQAEGADK